jgi:hypothetical protein
MIAGAAMMMYCVPASDSDSEKMSRSTLKLAADGEPYRLVHRATRHAA